MPVAAWSRTNSERESRTADAVPPELIDALTLEDLGGGRIPLPDSELLQELPPAQRALVIRYFELLNQAAALPVPEGPEIP